MTDMSAKERRHAERAQRADHFMDAQAEVFPAGSNGGNLAARLKEELVKLSDLDVARLAGVSKRQQGTTGRQGVRKELRALVLAVYDTANTLALDRPDVRGIFTLSDTDRSDTALIATARNFADALAPLLNLFAEYKLPASTVNELRSKADSLDHYIALQDKGLRARSHSNTSVEQTLRELAGLIERLHTLVRNTFREDPVTLDAWERARRLESAPHPKKTAVNPPPTPSDD
jgi:hypothetical protein